MIQTTELCKGMQIRSLLTGLTYLILAPNKDYNIGECTHVVNIQTGMIVKLIFDHNNYEVIR